MEYYNTIFVGLDVHKENIVSAGVSKMTGELVCREKFSNEPSKLRKHLKAIERKFNSRLLVCYEAGISGYALQRAISNWGYDCKIVAPSLIPTRPGDRRKTDRRDAEKLASLYCSNQLTFIKVPDKDDEPVRDILRYRSVLCKEILKSKHYVLKFVLRKGYRYTGKSHWTPSHWAWLKKLRFEFPIDQEVFDEYLILLEFKLKRQDEIDKRIIEVAEHPAYADSVKALRAYRGLDIHSAMVMLLETGDFGRFKKAKHYASFLGLVPSENSSGENQKLGHITKTGNAYCRHVLVQAAWNYCRPTRHETLQRKLAGAPAWLTSSVMTAQSRLYRKYWKLARVKSPKIAIMAVARELACFIWGTMQRIQQERGAISV